MNIEKMTREQFEELDFFKDSYKEVDVDGIILLPTNIPDSSGYNVFYVIALNKCQPVGKCFGYDVFDIFMESELGRVGIDCLPGSGLMRIFLPTDEYVIKPCFHQIVKK